MISHRNRLRWVFFLAIACDNKFIVFGLSDGRMALITPTPPLKADIELVRRIGQRTADSCFKVIRLLTYTTQLYQILVYAHVQVRRYLILPNLSRSRGCRQKVTVSHCIILRWYSRSRRTRTSRWLLSKHPQPRESGPQLSQRNCDHPKLDVTTRV